ncbi:type 1 glutamine amidotransferase [Cryptosporangium aurantiacum]|uniref:GMP synthase-Glutamine amidotransferase n=1 Tax=Cryptosporangium aurantiacum TaxID=134849 RepID=A0A1M7R832_9ACTN|nr:type 1 glutamine amidotransferase [Cryptosporangium aurantiacum]SHN42423.1 GMP synthase-Glutamine amidotransferase [Cryptosporangium aurantiacum]
MSNPRLLVVQNDAEDDARRLGDWLTEAGGELHVVRANDGEPLPADLTGYDGLVVLGGAQPAYDVDGKPASPWFPALRGLLREAVANRVATLGVCLGGQLLAGALGGRVEPARNGPEIGAFLVAKRDLAETDPLFAMLPFTPDVYQWHVDEITVLPPGAVLLASSPRVPHQAFRLGERAWGIQFHIECDVPMLADWAASDDGSLSRTGLDAEDVLTRCAAVEDDIEEVWRPFAGRFVALAAGRLSGRGIPLPVVDA